MQTPEKLQRELRFIEESYRSGIITKDEYETAKGRVEAKLAELERQAEKEKRKQERKEAPRVEVYHDDTPARTHPGRVEPESHPKPASEQWYAPKKEEPEEEVRAAPPRVKEERPEPVAREWPRMRQPLETYGRPKIPWKWLILSAITIFLIILIIFAPRPQAPSETGEPSSECARDLDCQRPGMVGTCTSPGEENARCTFSPAVPVTITVIEDQDCALCDTDRMRTTLRQIYPGAQFVTLEREIADDLIDRLGVEALPAYVLGEEVEGTARFEDAQAMFEHVDDRYVVKPTVSGASYFFTRQARPGQVEVFIDPAAEVSLRALENVLTLKEQRGINLVVRYLPITSSGDDIAPLICLREQDEEAHLQQLLCLAQGGQCAELDACDNAQRLIRDDQNRAAAFAINNVPVFVFAGQYKQGGSLSVELIDDIYCGIEPEACSVRLEIE